jgi:hypothetical protein
MLFIKINIGSYKRPVERRAFFLIYLTPDNFFLSPL